jgi:hypothetical protein
MGAILLEAFLFCVQHGSGEVSVKLVGGDLKGRANGDSGLSYGAKNLLCPVVNVMIGEMFPYTVDVFFSIG